MQGGGEILNLEATPTNGSRTITMDAPRQIIIDQTMDSLPEPYRVGR